MDEIKVGTRVWLESDNDFSFGPGQAEILHNIQKLGSLRKAAEHMGMSYRRAWGRIKKLESTLGKALVDKSAGNKAGYKLTPFAKELVRAYEEWADFVTTHANKKARELFKEFTLPPK